ncbi:hypothetical protein [Ruegeria arenilitoris]|uniref:hypothetical protein n=1 Tax=Ruegeria arenilitoris TaxID=1173585 RepID=UPI003C7CE254
MLSSDVCAASFDLELALSRSDVDGLRVAKELAPFSYLVEVTCGSPQIGGFLDAVLLH